MIRVAQRSHTGITGQIDDFIAACLELREVREVREIHGFFCALLEQEPVGEPLDSRKILDKRLQDYAERHHVAEDHIPTVRSAYVLVRDWSEDSSEDSPNRNEQYVADLYEIKDHIERTYIEGTCEVVHLPPSVFSEPGGVIMEPVSQLA